MTSCAVLFTLALFPLASSVRSCGLSILGSMWSPDERVNDMPFSPSLHFLMLTGMLLESTSTGVAVLLLGPLAAVRICSNVYGM